MRKRITGLSGLGPAARAFARDERGVTAIEFGFLALLFFTIIAAILETALVFLAGQILDSAVQDSARMVRTGRAQTAAWEATDFRTAICDGLYGLFDCTSGASERLRVSVTVVDGFDAVSSGYPLQTGDECDSTACDWTLEDDYDAGAGSNVVLVQAYYKWPTIVNLPGFNFATLPDGSRLLGASRVFMNEPFGCSGEECI